MNNQETKQLLREEIYKHCQEEGIYYRDVDSIRILTRCPLCGDSNDPNHAHFYIICDPTTNTNPGYKCFKCDEAGAITPEILVRLGIHNPNLQSGLQTLNKTASKVNRKGYFATDMVQTFDYKVPPVYKGRKTKYIEERLGRSLSKEDLEDARVVTSLHRFLDLNGIKEYRFRLPYMEMLERDYVGFLTYGKSHVMLRDITGKHDHAWVIYPISPLSQNNKVFYTMETSIDPLTTEPITVNLGEGVMDILSVRFNLGYDKPNTLNACVVGKHYEQFLFFLLNLGIVGGNVTINVFADNDMQYNKKAKGVTDEAYFNRIFKRFRFLYKEINIYWNVKGKDVGVPVDQISLKKMRIL